MSWFKKLKDKLVNISDFVLMSFNERNFMEDVNKMHKLNEDLHNTLYAEFVDIDMQAEINGEKFGLDQLERFRRIPSVITSHPYINIAVWEKPKYVWEHEEKCKRDQEAILKIIK